MKKLTDLRPCDHCGGPVGLMFYTLRLSLTLVKRDAVNQFMGMHQFFGGRANAAFIENFAPAAADGVVVVGDRDPDQMTELLICQDCFEQPIDLAMLTEKRRAAPRHVTTEEAGS